MEGCESSLLAWRELERRSRGRRLALDPEDVADYSLL